MKKLLPGFSVFCFSVFVFLVISSCQPSENNKPEEVLQRFGSGEISRRHYEINGKIEGLMTDYYPGGKVRARRHFKNGIQTGKTVFYYPDGRIKETQFFNEDGLKEGGDSTFYENGNLQMVIEFHLGQKNGYVRKWSETGELVFEAKYEMEKLVEANGKPVKQEN